MNHTDVQAALVALATPQRAISSTWFFKIGPGQYGEGDQFIGVTVPEQRKIAKQCKDLPLSEAIKLLHSPIHEHRLTALLILVGQYAKGMLETRQEIYDLYLANTQRVNNWDLVDSSADYIVGAHIYGKDDHILTKLAHSKDLWEKRIAMIATFYAIKRGQPEQAIHIATILEQDPHDLIQKAVGWMMREVGKRCDTLILRNWLVEDGRYTRLPRTALRYAIEHFSKEEQQKFLKGQL